MLWAYSPIHLLVFFDLTRDVIFVSFFLHDPDGDKLCLFAFFLGLHGCLGPSTTTWGDGADDSDWSCHLPWACSVGRLFPCLVLLYLVIDQCFFGFLSVKSFRGGALSTESLFPS